jgi:hypothetical protein
MRVVSTTEELMKLSALLFLILFAGTSHGQTTDADAILKAMDARPTVEASAAPEEVVPAPAEPVRGSRSVMLVAVLALLAAAAKRSK